VGKVHSLDIMKNTRLRHAISFLAALPLCAASPARQVLASPPARPAQARPPQASQVLAPAASDEFVGPFASWANAKRDFGAVGDGVADDTRALQNALDSLKADGKARVLWLPAGTYRITQTLQMVSQIYFGVIGEDPASTSIKWDGPAGGTMMLCNGARYGRFGRLTWDGAGRAETAVDHDWDGQTPGANSHNEHADEVFKDVGFGIRAGRPHLMDAECAVTRCRFLRCSKAGVSIESFNALDWWVRDSYFEGCALGVTNTFGAGHFHVYNSLFRGSTQADMSMGHTSYFGVRNNTSVGSRAFFLAGWIGAGAHTTLQNNTVLDPTGPIAIQIGNLGAALLLDNTIRFPRAPVAAKNEHLVLTNLGATTLSVGNTFTFSGTEAANVEAGKPLSIGDKIVPAAAIKAVIPTLPATAPNLKRPVIEVAPGSGAAAIQKAIDAAAKAIGKRAVVHFASGQYPIDKTLVVPANADVQLVGDGFSTRLVWAGGAGGGPVLRLAGPTRSTLREMEIVANDASAGVLIEKCDQAGARVWMDQGEVKDSKSVGLLCDGLDFADVSLLSFYHSDHKGVAVKVLGGPLAAAGRKTAGRTAIWGGASSNNALSYDVQRNGRLHGAGHLVRRRAAALFALHQRERGHLHPQRRDNRDRPPRPQRGGRRPQFLRAFLRRVSWHGVAAGRQHRHQPLGERGQHGDAPARHRARQCRRRIELLHQPLAPGAGRVVGSHQVHAGRRRGSGSRSGPGGAGFCAANAGASARRTASSAFEPTRRRDGRAILPRHGERRASRRVAEAVEKAASTCAYRLCPFAHRRARASD
jgi:pectin methylesterase-like acyl-CoA thioesterase